MGARSALSMSLPAQQSLFPSVGITKLTSAPGGVTGAAWYMLASTNSSDVYAVKQANAQFPLMLVAETVCAAVGIELGLPIPQPVVFSLPPSLAFATLRIPNTLAAWDASSLSICDNADKIPDVLAFDVLVANADRHDKNVLIERVSASPIRNKMWLIDHSHALQYQYFASKGIPPSECLRMPYAKSLVTTKAQVEPAIRRIKALDLHFWDRVFSLVPTPWIPDVAEVDAIKQEIIQRAANIDTWVYNAFGGTLI
jgi:hypothetical protein